MTCFSLKSMSFSLRAAMHVSCERSKIINKQQNAEEGIRNRHRFFTDSNAKIKGWGEKWRFDSLSSPNDSNREKDQQEPLIVVEPRRPPTTNERTETSFTVSDTIIASISKKSIQIMTFNEWTRGTVLKTKRNHFEVRVHGCAKLGHAGRWSIAKCRFSTKGSFDHHGEAEK